jgi:hypothetical protein
MIRNGRLIAYAPAQVTRSGTTSASVARIGLARSTRSASDRGRRSSSVLCCGIGFVSVVDGQAVAPEQLPKLVISGGSQHSAPASKFGPAPGHSVEGLACFLHLEPLQMVPRVPGICHRCQQPGEVIP